MRGNTILTSLSCVHYVRGVSWEEASPFTRPDILNETCSQSQRNGYDWSGLQDGPFKEYGSNRFQGWTFRDTRNVDEASSPEAYIIARLNEEPSITSRHGETMSIKSHRISSTIDQIIEFEYVMPDGSICREYHPSKPTVVDIPNRQCGGARRVTFRGQEPADAILEIMMHRIDFYCDQHSAPEASWTPKTSSAPAEDQYGRTSDYLSNVDAAAPLIMASTMKSMSSATNRNCHPVASPSNVSTTTNHLHQIILSAPLVLPRCLDTWIGMTRCQNATQYACFCGLPQFIDRALQCIASWSTTEKDAWDAASSLVMMCASDLVDHLSIIKTFPSYMGYPDNISSAATTRTELVTSTSTIRSTKTVYVEHTRPRESPAHLHSSTASQCPPHTTLSPEPLFLSVCASTEINPQTYMNVTAAASEQLPVNMSQSTHWLPWHNVTRPYAVSTYMPHQIGKATSTGANRPLSNITQFVSGIGKDLETKLHAKIRRLFMGLTILVWLLLL